MTMNYMCSCAAININEPVMNYVTFAYLKPIICDSPSSKINIQGPTAGGDCQYWCLNIS